jgi:long-chain fatty acid transport protein
MKVLYWVFLTGGLLCGSGWAANGTNLIGLSGVSQAMGGTGVAYFSNTTDALYKNPALLGEISGDGRVSADAWLTLFSQNASADGGAGLGTRDTHSGARVLPQLSASFKLSDRLAIGLGILSYGGAVVDYSGFADLIELKQELDLVRIVPAVAYQVTDGLTVGVAPLLSFGALEINMNYFPDTVQSGRSPHGSLGLGVQAGVTAKPANGWLLGASYTSKTKYNYSQIFDLERFGPAALSQPAGSPVYAIDDVSVQQPQEISVGASYSALTNFLFSIDYRFINWSSADSYRELGWSDQHVIALGAQYTMDKLALRLGFNYAGSVFSDASGENGLAPKDYQGHKVFQQSISLLNIAAFPAIAKSHITGGVGYKFSDALSADAAFVFAPKVSVTRSGTGINPATKAAGDYTYTDWVTQWSIAGGVTYKF